LPKKAVTKIKYSTAIVSARPNDPHKSTRQLTYLRALRTLPNVGIILPFRLNFEHFRRLRGPRPTRLPVAISPSEFGASPTLVIFAALMKPLSREWLPLSSSDPAVPPLIDSGYFTDPGDMPRTVHAMRVAEQLAKATLLSDIAVRQLFPCLQTTDSPTELKLRCALKSVRIFSMWVLVAGGQPPRPLQR
jgi:hypothetical protein